MVVSCCGLIIYILYNFEDDFQLFVYGCKLLVDDCKLFLYSCKLLVDGSIYLSMVVICWWMVVYP